jgi:hypothetical protein
VRALGLGDLAFGRDLHRGVLAFVLDVEQVAPAVDSILRTRRDAMAHTFPFSDNFAHGAQEGHARQSGQGNGGRAVG